MYHDKQERRQGSTGTLPTARRSATRPACEPRQ
jgi:hypothetical protein